MKLVSYNIHYAIGRDERYDLARVADAVRGADIIALQEVERHYGPPDGPVQPEDIATLLPGYYWAYDAAFDIDGSEQRPDGTVLNRRRQHGQMLLARWPILAKRYFPLPRLRIGHTFDMQMGALECLVDAPGGALRVYNVHFSSADSGERQIEAKFLLATLADAAANGGAWTGPADEHPDRDWSAGMAEPAMPRDAVVLGDFNMEPDSPEYAIVTGARDDRGGVLLSDAWAKLNEAQPNGAAGLTWHRIATRSEFERSRRLDYCFLTAALAERLTASWVDEVAEGSDHQPVWVELDL
ncbi:MAG: endonuclease/exonuclease/phosphatase family protein [Rhodospirillales bacterium]|nr:endonuclease/exonuclease/phosphatase family protein [Rhodospirillales bacterium]